MVYPTCFKSFQELCLTVSLAFAVAWAEQAGLSKTQIDLWANQMKGTAQ